MAASNRLDWRKNLSPLGIPPFIKQDLGSVLKPGEYRIGADFSVGQGDLTVLKQNYTGQGHKKKLV